jgi:hypothetical protein
MKIEGFFLRLLHYLGKGNKDSKSDLEKIDQLLVRLENRKDQLQHRLEKEKRACKQKRLRIELKIVETKLKKGKKRRNLMTKSQSVNH